MDAWPGADSDDKAGINIAHDNRRQAKLLIFDAQQTPNHWH